MTNKIKGMFGNLNTSSLTAFYEQRAQAAKSMIEKQSMEYTQLFIAKNEYQDSAQSKDLH